MLDPICATLANELHNHWVEHTCNSISNRTQVGIRFTNPGLDSSPPDKVAFLPKMQTLCRFRRQPVLVQKSIALCVLWAYVCMLTYALDCVTEDQCGALIEGHTDIRMTGQTKSNLHSLPRWPLFNLLQFAGKTIPAVHNLGLTFRERKTYSD